MRLHTQTRHIGRVLLATGVAMIGLAMTMGPVSADGNNGTIKIDGLDALDGPGHSVQPNEPSHTDPDNDPHVSCGFQVEFFNFDLGQTADITFTAHPPTGDNGVLSDQSKVLINDDGIDAVFDYDVLNDNVDKVVFDLDQFTSVHPVHGWHVKLDITVYDAEGVEAVSGAQKHKVFWVGPCDSTTTTTGSTITTTGSPTTLAATTGPPTTASVLGVVVTQAPAAPTQVLGVQLPRTGLSEVFLMAGVTALSLGLVFEALAQMAKRRSPLS